MLTLGLLGRMILYADDTTSIYAFDIPEELEDTTQRDVSLLHNCRNVLTMNVDKTCYMTFGKGRNFTDFSIKINDENIKRVTTFKCLGLVLDDKLSFNTSRK